MRPDAATPRSAAAGPIAFGIALLASFLLLVSFGHENSGERAAATINSLVLVVNAGLLSLAYLLAAVGIGRPLNAALRRLPGIREADPTVGPIWIQAALGLASMLWISHLLGVLGLLSGPRGLSIAWTTVGIGLLLLGEQVVRGPLRPERWRALPISAAIAAPALAVLLVAACSPPTALWLGANSEGGAYDVLSYHLQLPKEWIADGARLRPFHHNVYSFLPGYLEAAFLHVAALTRGGLDSGGSFVAGTGLGVIACQFLHAWLGVLTALSVGRFVAVRAARSNRPLPAVVAVATVLGVPWVMVVGSLAYNELGVTALLAGALLISIERSWSAAARGAAVGLLVGIACSVKPTALFMAAPVAGLFLLFARPQSWRDRITASLAGSAAGLGAMLPWLVRNWVETRNPVFPFARGVFGLSHWTAEQMERYAAAHTFHAGLGARISRLFDQRFGALNEQWAVAFPLGLLAIIALLVLRPTRRTGALLAASLLAQILAWLFLTHLQSRFLLTCVVPLAVGIGLAASELIAWVAARTSAARAAGPSPLRHLAALVVALVPLSLAAWSWMIFASQRAGRPNELLALGGVEVLTGHAYSAEFAQLQPGEQKQALENFPPTPFLNYTMSPDEAVYFLGTATPLFYVPSGGIPSIVYHTTWDSNPLGQAMRAEPDNPKAWTAALRAAQRGLPINLVLVDLDELNRLAPDDPTLERWYDPDVTSPRLRRWLAEECEAVRAWPNPATGGGMLLFRLRAAGAAGATP